MQAKTFRNSHICVITCKNTPITQSKQLQRLTDCLRISFCVCFFFPVSRLCIPNFSVFLVNRMLVVKTFLINCHNYCDHFCPNEQPDGRIWCHICDPFILIWLRVHLSTLCCLLCSQSVLKLSTSSRSCKFSFDYIRLLNIKAEGV